MQIVLPDELKEWCYYDIKSFSWQIKKDAPKEIIKKFEKHKEKSLERYKINKKYLKNVKYWYILSI